MKLAEALSLRADLQKRISQLNGRIENASKIQEGDIPVENPEDMLKELDSCFEQLEDLIIRINKTNQETVLADGQTLTAKIARRDILKQKVSSLNDIYRHLTQNHDRYSRQEIKYENVLNAAELHNSVDAFAKKLREVDVEIQATNWSVDLCD